MIKKFIENSLFVVAILSGIIGYGALILYGWI
jgi:hypothetical protein